MIIGFVIGPTFGSFSSQNTQLIGGWIAVLGTLFLKLVQMIPLIFASIIEAITALDKDQLKKLVLNIILYFLFTTTVAITIGIIIVYLINTLASMVSGEMLSIVVFTMIIGVALTYLSKKHLNRY